MGGDGGLTRCLISTTCMYVGWRVWLQRDGFDDGVGVYSRNGSISLQRITSSLLDREYPYVHLRFSINIADTSH